MASRTSLPTGFRERVIALALDSDPVLPLESKNGPSILSTLRDEYGDAYPYGDSILPLRRIRNEEKAARSTGFRIAPSNVARIAAERDRGVGREELVARTGLPPAKLDALLAENAASGSAGRVYRKADGTTRLLLGSTADGLVAPEDAANADDGEDA